MRYLFPFLLMCGPLFSQDKMVIEVTYEGNNTIAHIKGHPDDLLEFSETKLTHERRDWKRDERHVKYHDEVMLYIYRNKFCRLHIKSPAQFKAFEFAMNDWHHSDGRLIWVTNPAPVLRAK